MDSYNKIVHNITGKNNKKIYRTNDANNIHEIIKIYLKISYNASEYLLNFIYSK